MNETAGRKESEMERRVYRVKGLDCADEVNVLKGAVGPKEGIEQLDFDVLRGRMIVQFDADVIGEQDIVSAVSATGMEAVPWEEGEGDIDGFWGRHGRAVMTTVSGVCLLAGVLSHLFYQGQLFQVEGAGGYPLVSKVAFFLAAVAGGWYVIPRAVGAVRRLNPDMHLLMTVAVVGAMIIGEWFEAGTVAFLFAGSLMLEHWSVDRARRAIEALLDLSPSMARCRCPHDGEIEERPVGSVNEGTIVVVRPGEKVPLDGTVVEGGSSVNQAPITGESMLVSKQPGDPVYAGTVNGEGAFEFEVTHAADDTTLSRIIEMVEDAESRRAPAEQWVEKFARYYTPLMMALAVTVALVPPLLFAGEWLAWLYRGLVVLVIACPCALVISTPVSVVAGLTSSARNGVLIKGGIYLEAAGRLKAMALDKTGTLTTGNPNVQKIIPLGEHTEEELLCRAAGLEKNSEHPLGEAIVRRAEEDGLDIPEASDFRAVKGKGAEAMLDGRAWWIGSMRMAEQEVGASAEVQDRAAELEDAGHSVVVLGNEDHICGLISVADQLRSDAAAAVDGLHRAGVDCVMMLTGDNEGTARAVADAAGVDGYCAELMPEDKVDAVEELVEKYGHVGMVGDGINDAPAMATAEFGVAMGVAGTDVAIETGDVALMSDDLLRLSWLVRHSRRTLRVIQQNIGFALGLKLLFMVLAFTGLATLWMAIAADMGASLLVIFNGLRLLRSD
ncbi:MAG: heavy metal translocating P-type ATPase [Candidatus Brocadiia bacterium]